MGIKKPQSVLASGCTVDHSCVKWRCATWLFHTLSGGAAWCAGWRHTGADCRQVVKARRCRRSRSHALQNSTSVWFHYIDTITPHHRYQPESLILSKKINTDSILYLHFKFFPAVMHTLNRRGERVLKRCHLNILHFLPHLALWL